MNIPELRYLVALARERHFGHAAKRCFVSQPTLSIAIKRLEDELGVQLFERSRTDVTVTPAGESVIAKAQQALEAIDSVKLAASAGRDQLAGPLRIGAIYTVGPYLFPELISNLSELAPQMPLLIEENFTARLSERLHNGDLDVILISPPFNEPGIVTLPLYNEPFVALLPAAHPLSAKEQLRPSDLENEPTLLLGAGHCFRDQVIELCPACAGNSIEHREIQTTEGSSLETIRHMVASGMGVTVLPCTAAGADRYSQRLLTIRRFREPAPARQIALAWRASFPRPKVIDVLANAIARAQLSCITLLNTVPPVPDQPA